MYNRNLTFQHDRDDDIRIDNRKIKILLFLVKTFN